MIVFIKVLKVQSFDYHTYEVSRKSHFLTDTNFIMQHLHKQLSLEFVRVKHGTDCEILGLFMDMDPKQKLFSVLTV